MLLELQAGFLKLISNGIAHPKHLTYYIIGVLTVRLKYKVFPSLLMNSRSGDSSKRN